jgi:hypothetical protein
MHHVNDLPTRKVRKPSLTAPSVSHGETYDVVTMAVAARLTESAASCPRSGTIDINNGMIEKQVFNSEFMSGFLR